jgi:hypothetical protein
VAALAEAIPADAAAGPRDPGAHLAHVDSEKRKAG